MSRYYYGTILDDTDYGSNDRDYSYGNGGSDTLYTCPIGMSDTAADILYGGPGDDKLYSLGGGDRLYGDDGDDILQGLNVSAFYGGAGNDRIESLNGDTMVSTFVSGGDGNDTITGVFYQYSGPAPQIRGDAGNDRIVVTGNYISVYGGDGNDMIIIHAMDSNVYGGNGDDFIQGSVKGDGEGYINGGAGFDTFSYADNTNAAYAYIDYEFVSIEGIVGSAFDDYFEGSSVKNIIEGGDGSDTIFGRGGNDILVGGLGADALEGGIGGDTLTGGSGADRFLFTGYQDSGLAYGRDVITDFSGSEGDVLNFRDLALGEGLFVGTGSFRAWSDGFMMSQVRYGYSGSNTVVSVEFNGDRVADMYIILLGNHSLNAGNIVF